VSWLVLGAALPAAVVAWICGFVVRRVAPRWGWMDRPGPRKVHIRPVPTGGGVAIWLGIVMPLAAGHALLAILGQSSAERWLPGWVVPYVPGLLHQAGRMWGILAGGTVLVVLGLVDDRRGLDWRFRLAVQAGLAVAMVAWGYRLTAFVNWPLLTAGLSALWIVGLTNSFNMLDNMDGLSAGVAAICASLLAAVVLMAPSPATHQPQLFIGGFLLVLVGALCGFLWHNRPPARLFMGDAGAYLVGYLLAVVTLAATFAGYEAPHRILAPLCVLAVPLYDTATVVFIRLREGRSPFVGDKSHFSHRLVELGMTPTQAVLTIYLATATCGLGALVLHQVDYTGAAIVLLVVVCVLVLVGILETVGRRARNSQKDQGHGTP